MLSLDGSNSRFYKHWREVPASIWVWDSFKPYEIASHGDGSLLLVIPAMNTLQALRNKLDCPLIINDGYRDPLHNARIGGAPLSLHKKGLAFDISYHNVDKERLYNVAKEVGFSGFGHYSTFLHVDLGKKREWKK